MPKYRFYDYDTREYFYETMTEEELELVLAEHKNIIRAHDIPNIHTNTIGNNEHRKNFREVLNKIHQKSPGSTLNKTTEL